MVFKLVYVTRFYFMRLITILVILAYGELNHRLENNFLISSHQGLKNPIITAILLSLKMCLYFRLFCLKVSNVLYYESDRDLFLLRQSLNPKSFLLPLEPLYN